MSAGEQGEGPFLRLSFLSFCCCTAKQQDTTEGRRDIEREREKEGENE